MAGNAVKKGKLVVFSAPSGTGKSTLAKIVLERIPGIVFSVSATTRKQREGEKDGVNYYFLSRDEFEEKISNDGFIEHEYFFGNHYGTLLDKTEEIIAAGKSILFDLDVKGALNLKKLFGREALLVFIKPPDLDVLEQRLKSRESENPEQLKARLERALFELGFAEKFDATVVNDNLDQAADALTVLIRDFISTT
ncbi:MAG: guanylate kinase [Chlorobiaceae bacterium]|nr:guanylate kinase [Chlorobiaceae bacterium]NTV61256.1 guanylate kinase [Chlorobiaceae bacterium]